MSRDLRRRRVMERNIELAPIADARETETEDFGPELHSRRANGNAEGIDDGLTEFPATNGTPRRTPLPPHTPVPADNNPSTASGSASKPGKRPMDVNLYATKKTVAQGMMDLALLTANANQLRYVLESARYGSPGMNYYINLVLICLSITMQLIIGVALIFLGRYNVSREHHAKKADVLNNWVVLGVFFITVINVFISSLSIEPFHGVDPIMLRSALKNAATMAPDVTEKIISETFS